MVICLQTSGKVQKKGLYQKVDTRFFMGQTTSDEMHDVSANDDVLLARWSDM